MLVAELIGLVEEIAGVDPASREEAVLRSAITSVARLRAWLDSSDLVLATQLAGVVTDPEAELVDAGRVSRRDVQRTMTRATTVSAMPPLGEALAAGDLSAGHVDVVSRALRSLEPDQQQLLAERATWITERARDASVDELDRLVRAEVRRLQADDGRSRLERQRRAARLCSWIDDDGMWCLKGRFDPLTGARLSRRLSGAVDRLFAEGVPELAPTNPTERQHFLRAHALINLIEGDRGADPARTELVVVLDTTAPEGPAVDWGLPIELPTDVLHDLFDVADVHPVVVRNGAVLHAPGRLDLGRTTRIASRAQRRALRALYTTCAMPGCDTAYDVCKLHHVEWWEHGGRSDLVNLLPICTKHHRAIHDAGWHVNLRPDRSLIVTYPDGSQRSTGPPRRRTA